MLEVDNADHKVAPVLPKITIAIRAALVSQEIEHLYSLLQLFGKFQLQLTCR